MVKVKTDSAGQSPLKRASSPQERQQRRNEILAATYRLLRENRYETISLNTISREARLSKPSIYLYFSTREDIFLAVFMEAFASWIDDARSALETRQTFSVQEIADAMVKAAWKNEELRRMGPVLTTSIEKNISDHCMAEAIRLKQEKCNALCKVIRRVFPRMTETKTFHLMLCTMSLFGQFVSYEDNDCLTRVLNQPEFAPLQDDWEGVVAGTVGMLLKQILETGDEG